MATTTLAQYRTRISAELGLDNSAGGDQTLIDARVNAGYEQFLLDTHCQIRSDTATMLAGTGDYQLDSNIMAVVAVEVSSGGTTYGFERTSAEDVLRLRRGGSWTQSPPYVYAMEGSDLLMVWPTPSGGDVMTFYYVPRPTALSLSSDTPTAVPAEFHDALEFYAEGRLGSYDDDKTSAQGQRYLDLYMDMVKRCRTAIRGKGGRRLAPAVVNPRRRVMISHRNDTYP